MRQPGSKSKGYIRLRLSHMALFLLLGLLIGEMHSKSVAQTCDRDKIIEEELVLIIDQLTQNWVPKPQLKPNIG